MKEYRIIRTEPYYAIVNVKVEDFAWHGYTEYAPANADIEMLRAAYPSMKFDIVPYITLDVKGER